jgi:uncharacterized protein
MGTQGAFVIAVHDLDVLGRDVHFAVPPSWLRGALEGCEMQPLGSDGTIDVHVSKSGHDVLLRGKVAVELVIPCARCLRTVTLKPDIELSLLLAPAAPPANAPPARRSPVAGASGNKKRAAEAAEDLSFAPEEADQDTYSGDEVVLDRFVREAILLEAPIFPLCSEACEGIRPAPDSTVHPEAETDPRFLPLLELAKKRTMKE